VSDKRGENRHRKRIKVRYGDNQSKSVAFIEDISDNGFFIRTGLVRAPRSLLEIDLENGGETISLLGKVQWTKRIPPNMVRKLKCGMGIKIERFISGEETYRALMEILHSRR
jgi:hypothetical protein